MPLRSGQKGERKMDALREAYKGGWRRLLFGEVPEGFELRVMNSEEKTGNNEFWFEHEGKKKAVLLRAADWDEAWLILQRFKGFL